MTFWLDSIEVGWGDSLALRINAGLRECQHVLLCLSKAFLSRPWPEAELNAAFTMLTSGGNKKVLPLILNNKELVLKEYPLIAGLVYREYSSGPEKLASELSSMIEHRTAPKGFLHVIVESAHTGRLSNIVVSPRASVQWLIEKAKQGAGLKDCLDTGGFEPFRIRWVLVDTKAESEWKSLDRRTRKRIHAIVRPDIDILISSSKRDRLKDIGVYNDIIFHLYAVEDVDDDYGVFYSPRVEVPSRFRFPRIKRLFNTLFGK